MLYGNQPNVCSTRRSTIILLILLTGLLAWSGMVMAQMDICGCRDNPNSLGDFDSADESTYPPGTVFTPYYTITIPLPEDGVLIFDSFTVDLTPTGYNATVRFEPNAGNTPVTLLVKGDVLITTYQTLGVNGQAGSNGTAGINGIGGLGGPGGFRGGDGAYELVNFANDGGPGSGPGGGAGGEGLVVPATSGDNGVFVGSAELLPLVGGSGGGGGASTGPDSGCSGGGGGGGGGAIKIAANGTITVNGSITASGGNYGSWSSCASYGGRGSGGAIRLLADTIAGSGNLYARGGNNSQTNMGAIRMEAFTNTMSATNTLPVASRLPAPGPLVNPLTPTVNITTIDGATVPEPPQGGFGETDIVVPAPGIVTVGIETTGVPGGTTVSVKIKPQVGPLPAVAEQIEPLDNCNGAGDCSATALFDLPAGKFFVEAQATFQTQ